MNHLKTAAVLAALASGIVWSSLPAGAKDSSALELARQLNDAFVEVADKVSPSVVVIEITERDPGAGQDGSMWNSLPPEMRRWFHHWDKSDDGVHKHPPIHGSGSGIVLTPDGYILTNNHVVENADKIVVRFKDGRRFDAEVQGTDPESDIAVIKIKASGLTPVVLGDSDKTRVGEFVLAIGAPFDLSYSVTVGHVSAKGRSFEGMSDTYKDEDFIQTDASINPGNSGGPLVNLYGEVIGINAMIEGMNRGIGFAVPINLARRVEERLVKYGKMTRSWIGVRIMDLKDADDFKELDPSLAPSVTDGVLIEEIDGNGPAARSDLKSGDVVVAINGEAVHSTRQLKDAISLKEIGSEITLDVVRSGAKHVLIKIKTEAAPSDHETVVALHPAASESTSAYGLTVQPLSKELAGQYGVEITSGVIVTGVESNSLADTKIQPGDVITDINHQSTTNPREFREAIKASDSKRGVILNLIRNGSGRFVVLKDEGAVAK